MTREISHEWQIADAEDAVIEAAKVYYRSKSTAPHSDADILVAVAKLIELEETP